VLNICTLLTSCQLASAAGMVPEMRVFCGLKASIDAHAENAASSVPDTSVPRTPSELRERQPVNAGLRVPQTAVLAREIRCRPDHVARAGSSEPERRVSERSKAESRRQPDNAASSVPDRDEREAYNCSS
jgi:hypothetical protein